MLAEFTDKRCYEIWTKLTTTRYRAGGAIVWLTDNQLLLAQIKYPQKQFEVVIEDDLIEKYKKYIDSTIK